MTDAENALWHWKDGVLRAGNLAGYPLRRVRAVEMVSGSAIKFDTHQPWVYVWAWGSLMTYVRCG